MSAICTAFSKLDGASAVVKANIAELAVQSVVLLPPSHSHSHGGCAAPLLHADGLDDIGKNAEGFARYPPFFLSRKQEELNDCFLWFFSLKKVFVSFSNVAFWGVGWGIFRSLKGVYLSTLSIQRCGLAARGLASVVQALSEVPSLTSLDLSCNITVNDDGVVSCLMAVGGLVQFHRRLKYDGLFCSHALASS